MQVISLADFTRAQFATSFQSSRQAFTATVAVSGPTKSPLYFALPSNPLLPDVTTSHGVDVGLDFGRLFSFFNLPFLFIVIIICRFL